jgi:5-methyltetrahydropteroyltriglutamate--homocysteine methyltransferase
MRYAHVPVKQAVISFSARSLMYPAEEISSYSRDEFLDDLLKEHETEVLAAVCKEARIAFGSTSLKDGWRSSSTPRVSSSPASSILNNLALSRFSVEERNRIGVHTCPGSDCDSTHRGDVDYAELAPALMQLRARDRARERNHRGR